MKTIRSPNFKGITTLYSGVAEIIKHVIIVLKTSRKTRQGCKKESSVNVSSTPVVYTNTEFIDIPWSPATDWQSNDCLSVDEWHDSFQWQILKCCIKKLCQNPQNILSLPNTKQKDSRFIEGEVESDLSSLVAWWAVGKTKTGKQGHIRPMDVWDDKTKLIIQETCFYSLTLG